MGSENLNSSTCYGVKMAHNQTRYFAHANIRLLSRTRKSWLRVWLSGRFFIIDLVYRLKIEKTRVTNFVLVVHLTGATVTTFSRSRRYVHYPHESHEGRSSIPSVCDTPALGFVCQRG